MGCNICVHHGGAVVEVGCGFGMQAHLNLGDGTGPGSSIHQSRYLMYLGTICARIQVPRYLLGPQAVAQLHRAVGGYAHGGQYI